MLGIHSGGGGQPSVRGMPHMFRNASTAQDGGSLGLGLTREPSAPVIGKLQALTGQVTVTRANARITELVAGDFVYEGDLVETGHDGHVALLFADGTAFHLHANTRVVLEPSRCGISANTLSTSARISISANESVRAYSCWIN